MAMFGRSLMPALQAAMGGKIPGAILEQLDPRTLAQILGAPVPASGDFAPAATGGQPPQAQGYYPEQPATNYGGVGGLPPQPLPPLPPQETGTPASARQAAGYPPQSALRSGGDLPQLPPSMPPQPMYGDDPVAPKKKKNPVEQFFKNFAGFYGDALTKNPVYADHLKHKRTLEEKDREAQIKARSPQQVGSSIIVPNGQGGYRTLYRDPSTPEAYALAQGFQPGTQGYQEAVRQYRLGSWNDDAVEAKRGLAGYRYDRQGGLQDDRQEHASGMQDERLTVTRRGQDLTHQDRQSSTRQSDTNNRRSTGQSSANNQRSTDTSRENSIRSNETRLRTSRGGRQSAAPVRVNSLEEARRLPPGTVFQTPDGRTKVR